MQLIYILDLYTQQFLLKIRNAKISFCYAHKRPSPFFLYMISPQKNPLFNDKVWTYNRILVSKRVKIRKRKKRPSHKSRYRASAKISFIIAIEPFYLCRQNARKNITVTVSVRVSATVRVSLVLFGPVARVGPKGAGLQQKSSGPRQK